jgi:hypothetical protein
VAARAYKGRFGFCSGVAEEDVAPGEPNAVELHQIAKYFGNRSQNREE